MEALRFSSSDGGEDTDVLEYASEDSLLSDEEMASARASVEGMDDEDAAGADVDSDPPDKTHSIAAYQSRVGDAYIGADDGENSDSSVEYDCYDDQVGPLSTLAADRHTMTSYKSIGYFDTEAIAVQKLHQLNQFVYSYKSRYESTFRTGKEFQCRSHKDCQHRIKVISHRAGAMDNKFQLLEKGVHSGTVENLKVHGISPVIKPEVDALLGLGMAAGRVRNMMLFKYLTNPAMLLLIPETKQLENRKAYLTRKAGDGWEISKFITLRNWTSTKLCQTRADFYRVCESDMAGMNDLIVLDDFEHLVNVDGISVASLGVIVTSRALFRNVERAASEQGESLVLSTDGTYRIHFGGWTLVDCGGISGARSGTGYVQRFRPWLYMFVRTESIFAYERMFRALVTYAKLFFDVVVIVRSASIDHADAIASALESVWPHVEILTCWEHLLRNARKQTQLENTKGFIKDVALMHLRQLHESRSLKQFRALSKRVVSA